MAGKVSKQFLLPALVFLLPTLPSAADRNGTPNLCTSLDSCLAEIAATTDHYDLSIDKRYQALVLKLRSFGREAVPPLLQLLQSKDPAVRDFAGYVLSDMPELSPDDLPVLQAAKPSGNHWLPTAIARIGTPEAMQSLVADLLKTPEANAYTRSALIQKGTEAVPYLLAAYTCKPHCPDEQLAADLAFVFRKLDAAAVPGIRPLIAVAVDPTLNTTLRVAALRSLEAIGPYARNQRQPLLKLLASPDSQLAAAANAALVKIGDEQVLPKLLDKLRKANSPIEKYQALPMFFTKSRKARKNKDISMVFFEIARMGETGKAAGPVLEALLQDDSIQVAAYSAMSIGWIGYRQGTKALIEALRSPYWIVSYQAAWSLGRLRAKEAQQALSQLRDRHWSYPVRTVAAQALAQLEAPPPAFDPYELRHLEKHIFALLELISAAPDCIDEISWRGEYWRLRPMPSLLPADTYEEQPSFIPKNTRVVFQVDDGWLAGISHKELGDGLYHFDLAGKQTIIMDDANISGIYRASNGIVVVTEGVDQLGDNPGGVYQVRRTKSGKFSVKLLALLQAAPEKVAVSTDGTLIVKSEGAIVAVTKSGQIQGLGCNNS